MPLRILWFRRDLRLADHPALDAALADGADVVPLFVLDPALRKPSGAPRLAFLSGCLEELRERTGGALVLRTGDPAEVVPRLAAEVDASEVVVSEDFGPYGRERDAAVAGALEAGDRSLRPVGSPYALTPGTVTKGDGSRFRVFTPYFRAWRAPALREAADLLPAPRRPRWVTGLDGEDVPAAPDLGSTSILPPGEGPALDRLEPFVGDGVGRYADDRNRPDLAGTSRLSVYLKYGCIHPRTVLAALGRGQGPEVLRQELAWREFYATILADSPRSAREPLRPEMARMRYDTGRGADERFDAWVEGCTGYPIVDAGMRQLAGEAWVHNRVRMIVASFLVKDLHLDWLRGARLFMERLQDGDLASNNHGWQWVAGTGTDPAPYFRVFNPVTQGQKFDPEGGYIRRWVPELAELGPDEVHTPWKRPGGPPNGYPLPIVDHAAERKEALARYGEVKEER